MYLHVRYFQILRVHVIKRFLHLNLIVGQYIIKYYDANLHNSKWLNTSII